MLNLMKDTIKSAKIEIGLIGEDIIDIFNENDTLKNIPIVEYAVRLLNIKDIYHKKKIIRNYQYFIKAIQKMNEKDIENYLKKLNECIEKEDIVETIFEVITKSEKPLKAEILGNLSVALAKGFIKLDDYYTLLLIIQSASIPAIKAIKSFIISNEGKRYVNGGRQIKEESLLFSLGVAKRFGNKFELDENGLKLAKFGLKMELK